MFDKLLLISCICIVSAVILYFFHWNRLIGFLVGRLIRLMYWNEDASSIWVEIGSIHFSLITGRVLLKDVSYHSSNQSLKIVKGQIQWRYWIRRPTTDNDLNFVRGSEDQQVIHSSKCRIHISLQGFEWFIRNRTAAYETLISQLEANDLSRPVSGSTERRHSFRGSSRLLFPFPMKNTLRVPGWIKKVAAWVERQLPSLDPKDLLPFGLEITKGSIICGNESTPSLLLAEFQRSEGTFGFVPARSKLDLYKQLLSMKFFHAMVRYVENESYANSMPVMGRSIHERITQYSILSHPSSYLSYRLFNKLWSRLGLLALTMKYFSASRDLVSKSTAATSNKAHTFVDETTPVGGGSIKIEYAVERRILDTPLLDLSYYCDVVGVVPSLSTYESSGTESVDIGNGDVAPEWGFDIVVGGGTLWYGPWADRQRAELQRVFFPMSYHDLVQTALLKPGDARVWTAMRIFVELRDKTVLHIPFREPSKDWQWDGKLNDMPQEQGVRERATIDITVGDRSSINYTLPMVIGPSGYESNLEVHLDTPSITSSINDIQLMRAESCRLRCQMPTPLHWNLERRWGIALTMQQPIIYVIRDHINMLIDLGRDWTTGPPSDYQTFIPMLYTVDFKMRHYELKLYANDHNIIDRPLAAKENVLFTLKGAYFDAWADIPSDKYRPEYTAISFTAEFPDVLINLSLPLWNTNALHGPDEGTSLANVQGFRIEGSYMYFAEVRKDFTEQLKLKFHLHDTAFKNLGWSIRYFMVLRENYFGSFTHFSTLNEYLGKRKRNLPPGDPLFLKYRPGKNNILQVELQVFARNSTIIMPAGLPGYSSTYIDYSGDIGIGHCLVITLPEIQLQLRTHDYYMDMSLNVGAVTGSLIKNYPERVTYQRTILSSMKDIFHINDLNITANRLFGPQPHTSTYLCIWEVSFGCVKAILSASEGRLLAAAGNAFRLNYTDFANAPAAQYLPPPDPDVTFVKITTKSVDVTWQAGRAALVLSLPQGVKLDTNDLGGRYYQKVISLRTAEIYVKALIALSLDTGHWLEVMGITADAHLDIYSAPRGFLDTSRAQLAYVEEQDSLTDRAYQMLRPLRSMDVSDLADAVIHKNGLYLPRPMIPCRRDMSEPSAHPKRNVFGNNAWASATSLSESDAEELVSEAHRDARLAKSRSSTPMPTSVRDDDLNMSGGDESDDEDLTDSSSVSDWSDSDASENGNNDSSILQHYSYITRRYIAPSLATPSMWDGCPFILVRDRIPPETSSGYSDDHSDGFDTPKNNPNIPTSSEKQDTTTFRFKSKRPININVTPLLVTACIHFEEDWRKDLPGPEFYVDAMMVTHVGNVTSFKPASTLFQISLSSIVFRAFQRIPVTGDCTTIHEGPSGAKRSGLDVITIIQVDMTGWFASGSLSKGHLVLKTGFKQMSANLEVSIDMKTIKPTSSNDFILRCAMDDFKLSFRQDTWSLVIQVGQGTASIGCLGPEYIVATGSVLAQSTNKLAVLVRRKRQYASSLKQSVVTSIIRLSRDEAAVDLLSTTQPSYLVQSGIPQVLRTDATFRLLFHLRNCLWHLDAYERGLFFSSSEQSDRGDLIPLLESRLIALDPETSVARQSFLETFLLLLEVRDSSLVSPADSPPKSVSIQLTRMVVSLADPSNASSSELTMADVSINARILEIAVNQLPSLHPTSILRTPFPDKKVFKASTSVSLGNVILLVFPHLMGFFQQALRVRRYYRSASSLAGTPPTAPSVLTPALQRFFSSDIVFSLHRLSIQAAAENLVFEFGMSGVRGSSSVLLMMREYGGHSMNHSALLDAVFLRARSPSSAIKDSDQDILASFEITQGKVNSVSRNESTSRSKHLIVISVDNVQFRVPRSALRLYRFVQEWRADFLPGIESTAKDLLSELQRAEASSRRPQQKEDRHSNIQMQGQVLQMGMSLQIMHGTWLSWQIGNVAFYATSSTSPTSETGFGLRVASMAISIASMPDGHDEEPGTRVKLVLPSLSAVGHYDQSGVYATTLVDFIELKVKPSHWDTLLVVQQKFGQDFTDLAALVQETSSRQAASRTSQLLKDRQSTLGYRGFMKIRGFRIGLEGLASTMYLECLDIDGGINNAMGLSWNVELSDLAFSLAPRAIARPNIPGLNRSHRSAFVIVDFQVNANNRVSNKPTSTVIEVLVTKIHAVMQPSSIGEIGDFIDYLQAEMLEREEQRASELAAFKEKTRTILKTFEVGTRDTRFDRKSLLENYIISIFTRNIGVAFPLTHDQELRLPQTGHKDTVAVPAFLWSIKSIEFGTHQGQTGQVVMKNFSFQFVPRFRQSIPSDFYGENHMTRNRLLYPEMEAQLSSNKSTFLRHIRIGASVSGFILDIDSKIPSYVFSLIDVYNQGKARVERLSGSLPRSPSVQEVASYTEDKLHLKKRVDALPTSNIFAALTFLSGKVRVYSGAASSLYQARAPLHKYHDPSDEQVMEMGAEIFNLPVLSVWAEYRAAPSLQPQESRLNSKTEPAILMFKSTIHSSQNTLRPTLLSFFSELVSHIEVRLRRASLQLPRSVSTVEPDVSTSVQDQRNLDSISSTRVSFSLRIDKSRLELTCQPDVNVIAGLHWDSGGFVLNISPGSRKVTFTGAVGGLTLSLKHGFLSEDCVKLNARNLAFSITFSKTLTDQGTSVNSVSAILDTEFLGIVRFSRLQDILCFKAVWLDRIPVFNSRSTLSPKALSQTNTSLLSQPKTQFTTVILIRVRQITLDVDLGQSISALALDIKDAIMRTKLTEASSEASISVNDLSVTAKGNISGYARVSDCIFQTTRGNEAASSTEERSQMLELTMKSGRFIASLASDRQKLLHYRAEPLEVNIYDDWSIPVSWVDTDAKPLQLSFTVMSPEIAMVVTVGTIPKLLAYVNKFKANLDTQRINASRESRAFRATRAPLPANPLSTVTEAMLHSARDRFKDTEDGSSPYIIMQHMSLQLDFLRLIVFPRTMDDLEIAQFISRDVVARLDRLLYSDSDRGHRDLRFSFSSMTISKFTGLGHPQPSESPDEQEWLASLLNDAQEATIVGLPSMTMHMLSEEKVEDETITLLYDFYSRFKRNEGTRESKDIYITLNVSLYSWLTLLRKNLTREMDQVKAATDWRAVLSNAPSQTESSRKKAPDPLILSASTTGPPTTPSQSSRPFSPFSPTTALKSSMDEPLELLSPNSVAFPFSDYASPAVRDFSSAVDPPILSSLSSSIGVPASKLRQRPIVIYQPRNRQIERLTMRQLGEATPDVMHPFFMKRAGFNLEDSLPQYVYEYATVPLEEIMEVLLKIYSRQLLSGNK